MIHAEVVPSAKIRISTNDFRKKYQIQYQTKAIELLKKTPFTDVYYSRYIVEGPQKFCDSLGSFWNSIGLTAALIGAISITIAVATPTHLEALVRASNEDNLLSSEMYRYICRSFYIFWSCASICCIAAVLNITIATVHFSLMAHDEARIWFLSAWSFYVLMLPQIFLVVGCFCCLFGLTVGVIMISDPTTYLTVAVITATVVIFVLTMWLCMLSANKKREQDACKQLQDMITNEFELFVDPEIGDVNISTE